MKESDLSSLLETLEEIRREKHPEIQPDVIRDIALAQFQNQDDRNAAKNATMKIVAEYINELCK